MGNPPNQKSKSLLLRHRQLCLSAMEAEADLLQPLVLQAKRLAAQKSSAGSNNLSPLHHSEYSTPRPRHLNVPRSCPCSLVHETSEHLCDLHLVWHHLPSDPRSAPNSVLLYSDRDQWSAPRSLAKRPPLSSPSDSNEWGMTMLAPLDLPLQFKFVVDGCWEPSSEYATASDASANTNNVVVPKLVSFAVPGRQAAVSVCVRTSFDGWAVDHPMVFCTVLGKYVAVLPTPPGEHQIKFVCDGAWLANPDMPTNGAYPFQNNILTA
eukprot:c11755_g1_i1.p1 GENE.c11755_g1_i1~~c11755_g1_i1.p1  ORF type:complete len:301 (+),score=40.67 c11755_g1_i1:109-903(+)